MTKTKGFLLTAGIVLATTFTLSCSDDKDSDDKDDFEYLSCEELENLLKDGFMEGDPDTYMDNLKSSCETKHMSELRNCKDKQCGINIVMKCMSDDKDVKQLCGNDLETCGNHYDNACGFGD